MASQYSNTKMCSQEIQEQIQVEALTCPNLLVSYKSVTDRGVPPPVPLSSRGVRAGRERFTTVVRAFPTLSLLQMRRLPP